MLPKVVHNHAAKLIGRTKDRSVLTHILDTLAYQWRKHTDGFERVEHARPPREIQCGARILGEMARLATRSYEGKPLTTGIVVAEHWAYEDNSSWYWPQWLATWPQHLRPSIERSGEIDEPSLLADGKSSLMAADLTGSIRGVIGTGNSTADDIVRRVGGYAIVTNRHREVFLFDGNVEPVCHFDGFQWRSGGYVGPILWVDHWAHWPRQMHLYEKVTQGKFPVDFPLEEDSGRWFSFGLIVDALSDRRLSSILAVCDEPILEQARANGLITSLRPELDNVKWGTVDENLPGWINVLRLDGVHILSKDLQVLALCQQVIVSKDSKSREGTGRTAAHFLSEKLQSTGVVIKVSADGPVTVFYKGTTVESWVDV